MKAVFNKGKSKVEERYKAITETYNELIRLGSDKMAAIDETKRIHAPVSVATIYRAIKNEV